VYGTSSGAALALEAAASGLAITKLALWEPPFIVEGRSRPPADTARIYTELVRLRVLKEHELGVRLEEAPEGSGPYVPNPHVPAVEK
jgi:hypothetical protein